MMGIPDAFKGRECASTCSGLALPKVGIARPAITLLFAASVLFSYADTALGTTFIMQDGKRIEGEIVYASGSAVIVQETNGATTQLGRRAIDHVELTTNKRGVVSGKLESWTNGVYEISTDDKVVKVQGQRIIAERQNFPEITVTATNGKENTLKLVFELALSRPVKKEVLLIYSTEDGTALAGSDYEAKRGSVVLQPGSTNAVVTVPLLDDDLTEGNETFELLVTSDLDLATVKVKRGSVTILDNDASD